MAYTPENNPYIPGDPYSYDLKWMVSEIDKWKLAEEALENVTDEADRAKDEADRAKDEADRAADKATDAADSASDAHDSELAAKNYADNIADPVSGLVTTWLADHITQPTTPAIDTSLTIAGAAADAEAAGIAIRNAQLRALCDKNELIYLPDYLHAADTYIDASGNEVSLSGYNLYRIPYDTFNAFFIQWDKLDPFYTGLSTSYVFDAILNDSTVKNYLFNSSQFYYLVQNTLDDAQAIFLQEGNMDYLSICIKADKLDKIVVKKLDFNRVYNPIRKENAIVELKDVTPLTHFYINASGNLQLLVATEYSRVASVKAGDVVTFNAVAGWNYGICYVKDGGTIRTIPATQCPYTFDSDGIIFMYDFSPETADYKLYPVESVKLERKNIVNAPGYEFNGKNAVAFGTSLTYRVATTGGYISRLQELSGMTIENQGIGSAGLVANGGQIYTAITNYANYADNDLCIVEGFVNDWYQGAALGSYTDASTTVCGQLRAALNHIQQQNADIAVYLILDHYGRLYGGTNESSTEVRNGYTQYEYYEELAKVAESLGIRVIKLYADSGMNENTPQFFLDDIHPNATGVIQTGNTIWSKMADSFLNAK